MTVEFEPASFFFNVFYPMHICGDSIDDNFSNDKYGNDIHNYDLVVIIVGLTYRVAGL